TALALKLVPVKHAIGTVARRKRVFDRPRSGVVNTTWSWLPIKHRDFSCWNIDHHPKIASLMKTHMLKRSSLVAAALILTSSCADLTPSQNAAMVGAAGGALAGGIASAAGLGTAQSIATGLAAGAAVGAVTYVIAKHQATERQRQIAE